MARSATWKKLAALIIGITAGLVMAELLTLALGLAPEVVPVERGRYKLSENLILGYEPRPMTFTGETDDFTQFTGASNDLGFRDVTHTPQKPPGITRILVLGDSIAAGVYIDDYSRIFPARLQQILDPDVTTVEVINFGVSGYNTRQEVEILRTKGLQFQPDIVLVAYCLNDRFRVDRIILKGLHEAERSQSPINRYGIHRYFVWSSLYRLIRFRVMWEDPLDFQLDQMDQMDFLGNDTVEDSFKDLKKIADTHGFKVMITLFPNFRQLDPYLYSEEHTKIRQFAENSGFLFLDLLPGYRKYRKSSDNELNYDFIHPNQIGHDLAAEFIAEFIKYNVLPQ